MSDDLVRPLFSSRPAAGLTRGEVPPPVKAYKNEAFLTSDAARPVRVLCELLEPKERLAREGIENFLVIFGSARIRSTAEIQGQIAGAEAALAADPGNSRLARDLDRKRRLLAASHYYDAAVDLARQLTEWSKQLGDPAHRFYICSGGGPGIMEAANRGASLAGGRSIGLGISLPHEQSNNPYISHSLSFEFHYFFVRKYWFLYLAKALIVFPGGFGTMDEVFEMLTLIQTRKTTKPIPIVLFGSEFWNKLINWDLFIEWGLISPEDMDLFRVMDDVREARDFIVAEVTRHYIDNPNPIKSHT